MDVIELARASGLQVILDGRIGREEYRSVCGQSMHCSALQMPSTRLSGCRHPTPSWHRAHHSVASSSGAGPVASALQFQGIGGGDSGVTRARNQSRRSLARSNHLVPWPVLPDASFPGLWAT